MQFKYAFIAFGASIKGYRYMQKVIVIGGTSLKGRYGVFLLSACPQDGNFQIFPLAFGVVDSENDDACEWFLTQIQDIMSTTKVNIHEFREIIASVGWMNMVTNLRAFSPRIVRERLANLLGSGNGVMICGATFEIFSILINNVFGTPNVDHDHVWELESLDQAVAYLTVDHKHKQESFCHDDLCPVYHVLYNVCMINWIPGTNVVLCEKHLRF